MRMYKVSKLRSNTPSYNCGSARFSGTKAVFLYARIEHAHDSGIDTEAPMADPQTSSKVVTSSLESLLRDSIDYAGTFPPASLSLDNALRRYFAYLDWDEAWMLGRFVCRSSHLGELNEYHELFELNTPFRVSVLVGDGLRSNAFFERFESHIEAIDAFRERHNDSVCVESLEMSLPGDLLSTDVITVDRFSRDVVALLRGRRLQQVDFFLEVPLDENVRQTLPMVAGAVSAFNREQEQEDHGRVGIKMRTGGVDADAFPSPQSVAFFISTCCAAGVRFKATAGLHHPVRHYRPALGTRMHGFLNVFAASVFASVDSADEDQLVAVLTDEAPSSFSFSDDALIWQGKRAGAESIERARRDLVISFGSCSFEEPVQDLRDLGFI